MIRKGSTVAYKCYRNNKKYCGIGKIIDINKQNNTCRVMDIYEIYDCFITDCENTCNW